MPEGRGQGSMWRWKSGSAWGGICVLALCLLIPVQVLAAMPERSLTGRSGIPSSNTSRVQARTPKHALDGDRAKTLASLKRVDRYPLYTMTYEGGYVVPSRPATGTRRAAWACSLFVAMGKGSHALYGRNFDWEYSPALLLFTHPAHAYASVSMVDISYLGFRGADAASVQISPHRVNLLKAPLIPFDGMNAYGLTVGMAAVPDPENIPSDARRPTVGSLGIIRIVLDHARSTSQAVRLMQKYRIDFSGGPPLHYLIADPSGQSAVVEFRHGGFQVVRNGEPWQIATNFFFDHATASTKEGDSRYRTAAEWLKARGGRITPEDAMSLLSRVRQDITQWSVVYDMSARAVRVVMGRAYHRGYSFQLSH